VASVFKYHRHKVHQASVIIAHREGLSLTACLGFVRAHMATVVVIKFHLAPKLDAYRSHSYLLHLQSGSDLLRRLNMISSLDTTSGNINIISAEHTGSEHLARDFEFSRLGVLD
jgi:hypothetical protein